MSTTRDSTHRLAFWKRRVDQMLVVIVVVVGSSLWALAPASAYVSVLAVSIIVLAGLALIRAWLVRKIRERRTPDDEA